jgi:large conductance mechanosensitive channel
VGYILLKKLKEKAMLKEFKEFAMRGNMIDLAVAVIIGGAIGKIISSLVADIIMPPIGLLLGKVNFSNMFFTLSGDKFATLEEAKAAGAVTLNYGLFLIALIDFLIIAFVLFLLLRSLNKLQKAEPVAAPTTKECPYCLSTIPLKAVRCPNCTSELK